MREWWVELLIQAAGGLIGTVAAAGVIAFAGKAAGLFDAKREFNPRTFLADGAALVGAAAGAVTLVAWIIDQSSN